MTKLTDRSGDVFARIVQISHERFHLGIICFPLACTMKLQQKRRRRKKRERRRKEKEKKKERKKERSGVGGEGKKEEEETVTSGNCLLLSGLVAVS